MSDQIPKENKSKFQIPATLLFFLAPYLASETLLASFAWIDRNLDLYIARYFPWLIIIRFIESDDGFYYINQIIEVLSKILFLLIWIFLFTWKLPRFTWKNIGLKITYKKFLLYSFIYWSIFVILFLILLFLSILFDPWGSI